MKRTRNNNNNTFSNLLNESNRGKPILLPTL